MLYFPKFHKSIITTIAALLIIFYGFYFLIIPKVINIEKYRVLIVTQTAKNLKLPISIGKSSATMTWNGGIVIHSKSLNIKHVDSKKYISTGPIEVEISIPYIFRHQIRVRRITVQNPEIMLTRLPNGKYDIEELISERSKKQLKYKTIFKDTNIILNNYKINFEDRFIYQKPKYYILGDKIKIYDFEPKKKIKINAQGKILSKNRSSTSFNISYSCILPLNMEQLLKNDILLSGTIKNFYPDMFMQYLNNHKRGYYSLSGAVDSYLRVNFHKKDTETDELLFNNTINNFSIKKAGIKSRITFPGITEASIFVQKEAKNLILKEITIKNNKINAKINGNINKVLQKNPELNLNVDIQDSKIDSLSAVFPKTLYKKFKKYKVKGVISTNIEIKGPLKEPDLFGTLEFKKMSLARKSTTIPNMHGKVIFNGKTYNINSYAQTNKYNYISAYGYVAPRLHKIDLDIKSNNINFKPVQQLLLAISDISSIKPGSLDKTSINGKGNININISGDVRKPDIKGYLNFINTDIRYPGLTMPLNNLNGQIGFWRKNLYFNDMNVALAKTNVNINGWIVEKTRQDKLINLHIKSQVDSKDIKKYINPHLSMPIEAEGIFPLTASVSGNVNDWKLSGQLILHQGDYINLKQDTGLPSNEVRVLTLKALGNKKDITIKDVELTVADHPEIVVKNIVYDINSKRFVLNNVVLNIADPINIQILNPLITTNSSEPFFTSGTISTKLKFSNKISSQGSIGNIILKDVTIPSKNIKIHAASIDLTPDSFVINDSDILLADSQMKLTATAEKNLKLPIIIKKINITSPDINFGNVADSFKQTSSKKETKKTKDLPIGIQDGEFKADKFIIGKLIGTDLATNFKLNTEGLFNLEKYVFKSAEGVAEGMFTYDLKKQEMISHLVTQKMDANDLATTFMNLHDEVYGKLDSTTDIRTDGTDPQEMIANADGKTEFQVKNGHLVRLGSLEYLLLAGNTLTAGIGNLSLNKIVNLVSPVKTGYFKVLKGTITAKNGILHTDNIKSKGKNLSLHLRGSLRMSDNYADLVILGKLRKKVAGKLGPLGSLSINSLVRDIPVAGFLPGSPQNAGIVDLVPLIDQIPELDVGGRRAQRNHRFFIVRIVGNLYDPKSVRSFRWIDKKSIKHRRNNNRVKMMS